LGWAVNGASGSVAAQPPPFYIRVPVTVVKGGQRMDLKDHIRGIPDFPKPGILFYDISTLLRDADAWQVAMGRMA
jgi:hypothetical protein